MRRYILLMLTLSFSICKAQENKQSFERVIEHYLFKSTSDRLLMLKKIMPIFTVWVFRLILKG